MFARSLHSSAMTARNGTTRLRRTAVTIPIVWSSASFARGARNTHLIAKQSRKQGGRASRPIKASSSIGRALVSKTSGCGFKSCLACKYEAKRRCKEAGVLAVRKNEQDLGRKEKEIERNRSVLSGNQRRTGKSLLAHLARGSAIDRAGVGCNGCHGCDPWCNRCRCPGSP